MASHSPKGVYRLVVLSSINYCKCKYSVKVTKWLLQKLLQQANSVWPFALSMSGYCVWRSTLQTAAPLQAICAKWKPSLGGSSAASLASVDLSCVFGWRSTLRSHVCTQRFKAPTTVQCFKHVKFIETCTLDNFTSVPFPMGDKFDIVEISFNMSTKSLEQACRSSFHRLYLD